MNEINYNCLLYGLKNCNFVSTKSFSMKYLITAIILCLSTIGLFAQQDVSQLIDDQVKKSKVSYELDADQTKKLKGLLSQKYAQLEQINGLKSSDVDLFRAKRRAIYKGHEGSVQIMLNKEQKELYTKAQQTLRIERAKKIEALRKNGASMEDIKDASLGIEK